MNIAEFGVPPDGGYAQFCLTCRGGPLEWVTAEGRRKVSCLACGARGERALVVDPRIVWWTGPDGEYWHETAGIFVRDDSGRFLLFDRVAFPYALTVPAGHVERGEDPGRAAARELREETALAAAAGEPVLVASVPVPGDSCRRGSDAHLWQVHLLTVPDGTEIRLNEEGRDPRWLTLDQALARDITPAVRHVIGRHAHVLLRPHPHPEEP